MIPRRAALLAGGGGTYNPIRMIDDNLGPSDGVYPRDITGNGFLDILASTEPGQIYWFEQTSRGTFARHTLISATVNGAKQESAAFVDVDGDGFYEVVVADQANGQVRCYKQSTPGNPQGTWTGGVIKTGFPKIQGIFPKDLDGDGRDEIVCTVEGTNNTEGGLYWLDWQSGDPTSSGNYNTNQMIAHPGAWWVAGFGDFSGGGSGLDLIFSARNHFNANSVKGLYKLTKPATVTDLWTEATIESGANDWMQCDIGDFFGTGVALDLAAVRDLDVVAQFYLYDKSNSFAKTTVSTPSNTSEVNYNIRRLPYQCNGRDGIFTTGSGKAVIWLWNKKDWVNWRDTSLAAMKSDNRIPFLDTDGSGVEDVFLVDSVNNIVRIWRQTGGIPISYEAPALTGTYSTGQTMTCTGRFAAIPSPSYAYQWKLNGVAIGGETASTHVVSSSDAAGTLTCLVTASNSFGAVSAESAAAVVPDHNVLIDRTAGTNIGDMTSNGGLAAAFDGVTNQASAACAVGSSSANRFVGKTLASAKKFGKATVYGSNNSGYISAADPSVTVRIYGKSGVAPVNDQDGTILGTISFTDTTNESVGRDITSTDTSTSWDHMWVRVTTSAASTKIVAELVLYEYV